MLNTALIQQVLEWMLNFNKVFKNSTEELSVYIVGKAKLRFWDNSVRSQPEIMLL